MRPHVKRVSDAIPVDHCEYGTLPTAFFRRPASSRYLQHGSQRLL